MQSSKHEEDFDVANNGAAGLLDWGVDHGVNIVNGMGRRGDHTKPAAASVPSPREMFLPNIYDGGLSFTLFFSSCLSSFMSLKVCAFYAK